MDQVGRVWLVFDGDLLSVHASNEGAAAAKEHHIKDVVAGASTDEPEYGRARLEAQVTIVEAPLLP